MKKDEYQVTIIYKACLVVDVKANSEEEARKLALEEFKKHEHFGNKVTVNDSYIKDEGVINFTKSWGEVQK